MTLRRLTAQILLVTSPLLLQCSLKPELPEEPETDTIPTGEIAYIVQYRWEDVPGLTDLVLTRGQILYAVEDSTRVSAWFSDKATPTKNDSRSIPEDVMFLGQELQRPVQICEGANNTLWVAYLQPEVRIVQFDVSTSPPQTTGRYLEDSRFLEIGGLAADPSCECVYVSDSFAHYVAKYEADENGGRRMALLATEGRGDRLVEEPRGLFFFSDSLLVADTGKSWIQVIDAHEPNQGRGQVMGPEGNPLLLSRPVDVWVDRDGFYYVADFGSSRVLQLRASGEVKEVVTGLDSERSVAPPTTVANRTQVWVPDPETSRLTVYQINTAVDGGP